MDFLILIAFGLFIWAQFKVKGHFKKWIVEGLIWNDEKHGMNTILWTAALTYVAAAFISVLELLKYVLIFFQGTREEEN